MVVGAPLATALQPSSLQSKIRRGLKEAFVLAQALREKGIYTEKDYLGKSLKAQMKAADRFQAKYTVILAFRITSCPT